MKTSVLQFTRQSVANNKEFIEGNIAEYLILNVQSDEYGYHGYFSDDESHEYDGEANANRRCEMRNEVEDFINENFDFDISEFEY